MSGLRVTVRAGTAPDGRAAIYPACRAAMTFARIAGTQTLSTDVLAAIQSLGFAVQYDSPAVLFAQRAEG